jgi:hypothetical protein
MFSIIPNEKIYKTDREVRGKFLYAENRTTIAIETGDFYFGFK